MCTEQDIDLTRHASARDIYRGCIHLDYLQSVCVLVRVVMEGGLLERQASLPLSLGTDKDYPRPVEHLKS